MTPSPPLYKHISLLITISCLTGLYCCVNGDNESNNIHGMFVFGSSLVDNGNNNFLDNMAKADYLPYGIDFPSGPSGRFTNGKNVIDLLCDQIRLPSYIPAFANPSTKGRKIVHGVNYASGASGILDDTGSIVGNVTSLSKQIRNFEEVTLPDLEEQLGSNSNNISRESLPNNYLFILGTGGNDYSFNYFMRKNTSTASLQAFTDNLMKSLSNQIQKLYNLGARKLVLMSINPIGCSPMVLTDPPGCLEGLNEAAQLFNAQLQSLVDVLKPQMPGSNLVFVNSYEIIREIIRNPASRGFKDASNACCEIGSVSEGGSGILCKRGGDACEDRTSHVFFDGLHPTEAVNVEIADKAYASNVKTEVYPINVRQLVSL
ncbi:hypothetical protein HS088_TW23G00341 [Tripterygium wilfordii]|uniref:GDSL esterase/lipase n=1 Tax=Tripterygium wilfordii TaxID=458696 RepID=A0A7J7BVP1_TRIWF|nr:GDSL esterase/lipase At1g29670-like [Tripterygium wilfordii]KAF5725616.1 hypothetical protein HS088_TW23G00341 [Tripterygium wilfordii]